MQIFKSTMIALVLAPPVIADPEISGLTSPHQTEAILNTMEELDLWLDAYTDLPRSDVPLARLDLVPAGSEILYEGQMMQLGPSVRGVYDALSTTIYLVHQWYGETAFDRSVLLHEMVHHRQATAQHWYCPQAMEWDAYLLQERYLNDHDQTGDFNWAWVVLSSSCAVRDHHPD